MNQSAVDDAPMDAGSRTERAYQRLRQEILVGELAPNERLRVADLEARFELGLTPIREALARLASEGLVSMEARRGARVLEASPAELADLMKTRREIERLCLTESIKRGDSKWEAEVLASLHVLGRAPLPDFGDRSAMASEWEAHHRRFHAALVSACGSEWLLRFWNQLVDHSQRYRKNRLEGPLVARDVQAEHQAILDAVLRRDADAAVALMDRHLRDTEEAALAALRQAGN
ncbi:GntR family transcriptional regulator [Acidovorax cavernicola]|uniref:FCD domain-containing protein n=1 Tax=Acidovorax cavernicola TaxID=1675792 RepID=A0A9X8GTH7_9BURK|nr:FCD domain-containing protein [Acidovorax cavernicola]RIX76061.1 FCD domain-containing protein [Acidovorax cavernicola]